MFESAKGRPTVLVNSHGNRWTLTGFNSSIRKEKQRLDLGDVTLQDLRGTGVSYACAQRISIKDIANVTGHSENECEAIIRKHYLAGESVIDAIRAGTN